MSTSVGGGMYHGESGLRILEVGNRGTSTHAALLVDYGADFYATRPRVMRILDAAELRRLVSDAKDILDPDVTIKEPGVSVEPEAGGGSTA